MERRAKQFLYELLETPSPSGFEQPIQRVVKRRMQRVANTIEVDVHGNLIAAVNPDAPVRIMLAGHCDQIGMMVTHIDDRGFIAFKPIGGIDASVLPGSRVEIHTDKGPMAGVIGHKPIHLIPQAERGKKVDIKKLWIDTGFSLSDDVKKRVRIGDPVTFVNSVSELGSQRITAPACDDRVGVFVVMEALRLFKERLKGGKRSSIGLFAVSTVQEELGLRGARTSCFGIDPVAGIAVDVTHASDNPGAEAREIGTVKMGDGPTIARGANINPVLESLLHSTARKKRIKVQPCPSPSATGTDANAIQVSRAGVAAALIGIPNRYMHTSTEMVDLRDVVSASKLVAETVLSITSRTSFIPV
jgi:endoglucanase